MQEAPSISIGWSSRGYLPHFDGGPIPQAITYRLAGSLPAALLARWRRDLSVLPAAERVAVLRRQVESQLDRCREGALATPAVAAIVEENLLYFDARRCRLHAWVIMPNHVHILATPCPGVALAALVQGWKAYTAARANAVMGAKGRFWQPDYFDRFIRNERHFRAARRYMEENPVKAGLCRRAEDWRWGSAWWRARLEVQAPERPKMRA